VITKNSWPRNAPSTGSCTFLAESTSAEFAAQKRGTTSTDYFTTIITLIHFIAGSTIEGIAPITDSNFMIGLKFVTPVTIVANIGLAFIAADLNIGGRSALVAVQTAALSTHSIAATGRAAYDRLVVIIIIIFLVVVVVHICSISVTEFFIVAY
jgi:hypothetical protein